MSHKARVTHHSSWHPTDGPANVWGIGIITAYSKVKKWYKSLVMLLPEIIHVPSAAFFFSFLLLLMFLRVYFSEAQLCLVQIILCAHLLKVKGRKLMTTIKWSPSLSLAVAAGTAQLTLVWFCFPVNGGRWFPLSFCCAISAFVP